jgi:archaellum component FlaC
MVVEIILGLLVLSEGYVIWNLTRKTEMLETWVEDFTQTIETVQNDLKDIDSTGHFESDDEVGTIFEQIKETVNQLESYRGEDVDAS